MRHPLVTADLSQEGRVVWDGGLAKHRLAKAGLAGQTAPSGLGDRMLTEDLEKLERLAALFASGALSEAEYQRQKASILSRSDSPSFEADIDQHSRRDAHADLRRPVWDLGRRRTMPSMAVIAAACGVVGILGVATWVFTAGVGETSPRRFNVSVDSARVRDSAGLNGKVVGELTRGAQVIGSVGDCDAEGACWLKVSGSRFNPRYISLTVLSEHAPAEVGSSEQRPEAQTAGNVTLRVECLYGQHVQRLSRCFMGGEFDSPSMAITIDNVQTNYDYVSMAQSYRFNTSTGAIDFAAGSKPFYIEATDIDSAFKLRISAIDAAGRIVASRESSSGMVDLSSSEI